MRDSEGLRARLGAGGPWLRLGLASATIMAPLLSRWSDLRAAERARALADEAEARLHDLRGHLNLAPSSTRRDPLELVREARAELGTGRGKVSTRLWLVGVGVGLVAASTGAYILVRRRMAQAIEEESLVELSVVSVNGNGTHPQMVTPEPAPAPMKPAKAGPAGDGAVRAEAERRPTAPAQEVSMTENMSSSSDEEPIAAPFIGNIHTLVYHEADDDDLPAEENRIYFASEEEAREAGYRRHRDEVAPGAQIDETTG